MRLSNIIHELNLINECKCINEQDFDYMARITSKIDGTKCVFLSEEKYIGALDASVKMLITTEEIFEKIDDKQYGICICKNPKVIYNKILNHIAKKENVMLPTRVGKNCVISPLAYIAPTGVVIGDNVIIDDHVSVYEGTSVENDVVIHAGARVGIQDYNYYVEQNSVEHLTHIGKTIIKNNVEIGYNSVIGRALYGYNATIIGEYTKIGNCVLIGHDSKIGKMSKIYSSSTIGGNVRIGDNSNVYMGVTMKNAIVIGNNCEVEMGSVVIRDVEDGQKVFGNPARRMISPGDK